MFPLLLQIHQHSSEQEANTCSSLLFIDFFFTSIESHLNQIAISASSNLRTHPSGMQQRTGRSCSICGEGSGAQEAAAVPQRGFSHISSWNLSHHEENEAKPFPYRHPRPGGETNRLFVQNNSRMQHNLEDIMKCFRNGLRQITTVSRAKYSSGCTYFQSTGCLNVRRCNSALQEGGHAHSVS